MANVLITHSDGRRFDVSEQAFTDLYQPDGFVIEAIFVDGVAKPATEANRTKAEALGTVKTHEQIVRESMARTDMQTNGVSLEDAAKAYGLDPKDLKAASKAPAAPEVPEVIAPVSTAEALAPAPVKAAK